MRVKVAGHGVIKFPDGMPEKDIREFLKQFEPKKDDTIPKLIKSLEEVIKSQKPLLVKEPSVQVVKVPEVIQKPEIQTITVERIVEVPRETTAWRFRVDRDEDGYDIFAEPVNG